MLLEDFVIALMAEYTHSNNECTAYLILSTGPTLDGTYNTGPCSFRFFDTEQDRQRPHKVSSA